MVKEWLNQKSFTFLSAAPRYSHLRVSIYNSSHTNDFSKTVTLKLKVKKDFLKLFWKETCLESLRNSQENISDNECYCSYKPQTLTTAQKMNSTTDILLKISHKISSVKPSII